MLGPTVLHSITAYRRSAVRKAVLRELSEKLSLQPVEPYKPFTERQPKFDQFGNCFQSFLFLQLDIWNPMESNEIHPYALQVSQSF